MFPKKGTRSLTIDDDKYLWRVSVEEFYPIILCRKADVEGSILEVSVILNPGRSKNESPRIDIMSNPEITPSMVRFVIVKAVDSGWRPDTNGQLYRTSFNHLTKEFKCN